MKKIIFFSLATLAWASVFAQIRLSGTVRDSESKESINGAVVLVKETNQTAETASDGAFKIELSNEGTYNLSFLLLGYEEQSMNVSVMQSGANVSVELVPSNTLLNPAEVSALRANESTPVAYENVEKEEIEELNTGRDIPYLLEQTPSVVTTSDAGAGVGYTNMRVRGSDITRINVTVNGIPLNDAESHGVFFVNMPDFASTTNSMQLQRGVGTSTNGAAAFGASLNMETDGPTQQPFGSVNVGFGSFNTQRYNAQFGSGLLNKHWWISGRISKVLSDGYIDRASSDLTSFYGSGGYIDEKTSVRAVVFSGRERTYQSWNGIDSASIESMGRTFNSAGAIYDENWNVVDYYDDEVDNYGQDHYQLHWNQILSDQFKLNVSMNYTRGSGYFENYKQGADFAEYMLNPIFIGGDTINSTDLVRRKWLDNHFYGGIFNLEFNNDKWSSILGGGIFNYEGDHFGEVIWARFASQSENDHRYYDNYSNKLDWNVYWKNLIQLTSSLTAFVDLQIRGVDYKARGTDDDFLNGFAYEQSNLFFNPKVGVTYQMNDRDRLFFSYGMGNKEPNRSDLIYADPNDLPEPETLHDFELGYDMNKESFAIKANVFYMYYVNQLVLSGQLDGVGFPIRENVGQSYRTGVEVIATWQPLKWLRWSPNVTFMQSQNLDYFEDDGSGTLTALGNTAISYSPTIIGASTLEFIPVENLSVILFSKFVGKQYLNNSQVESLSLPSYFVNDIRISYNIRPSWIGNIRLYAGAYNIFSEEYASNGYTWGPTPYYYPQATINFLGGIQIDL